MKTNVAVLRPSEPTKHDHPLIRQLPPIIEGMLSFLQTDGRLAEGTQIAPALRQQMTDLADRLPVLMDDKRPKIELQTATFLLASFPRQSGSAEATDMLVRAYEVALEEVPTWAVEEAARRWLSGKCGAKHWAPSPPELRCAADEVVTLAKGRAAILRSLAKAEVVSAPAPDALARAKTLADFIKPRKMEEDPA